MEIVGTILWVAASFLGRMARRGRCTSLLLSSSDAKMLSPLLLIHSFYIFIALMLYFHSQHTYIPGG